MDGVAPSPSQTRQAVLDLCVAVAELVAASEQQNHLLRDIAAALAAQGGPLGEEGKLVLSGVTLAEDRTRGCYSDILRILDDLGAA